MSNYRRILDQFVRAGHKEQSKFDQYRINEALDKIVQNNMNINEFSRDVAQQLFEQTDKDINGQIFLKDYINTIVLAQSVLERHIQQYSQRMATANNQQDRQQISQSLQQFHEDYQLLTRPFHINTSIRRVDPVVQRTDNSKMHASIFSQENSSPAQQSSNYKIILILTVISFLFQLILMFAKHHFLNCLAYLLVLSIFFLNYFDRYTIKISLLALFSSLVLDFVWLLALSSAFWNGSPINHHSTLQQGFLKFIYVMTIILMIPKVIISIILLKDRQLPQKSRKVVTIGKIAFDLNGNVNVNPFKQLFTGKIENYQNQAFV